MAMEWFLQFGVHVVDVNVHKHRRDRLACKVRTCLASTESTALTQLCQKFDARCTPQILEIGLLAGAIHH